MALDDSSTPTINVGKNFTQENISGQNATGNNISQRTLYNDCTFVYPDGSTKEGCSWTYTQGARPAFDPKRIFGREKELENIENLLKEKSSLVITGLRGTGKSTLASMFIDRAVEKGKFAGIYWRKVDETTDISDIIGSFFTVIGKPVKDLEHYKIPDQINLLFHELSDASYLLVLDNFEILLNPQTDKPLESKVGFSDLIKTANENCIRSKILFTSWESPASDRGIRPIYYQIKGLDTSAGVLLLKREGLNNSDECLKNAVEKSGGHPLALILLAQLVRDGMDTLSSLLKDGSLWSDDSGEIAENILNKVYNERLSEVERILFQYISIFRQPVPVKAITAIVNDPKWSESKVRRVALSLIRKSLLQKEGENYWEESLISKYAEIRLSEKLERHELACRYYLSCPIPAKPAKKEDVQPLIEAHYHACMTKEYDEAFHIIFDNDLSEKLSIWGNCTVLVDLYLKMLPEDHFGNEILLGNKKDHNGILGNLGVVYNDLGYSRKAIKYYEQALKIAKEIEDGDSEGTWLGNMGNAYLDMREPRKAIEYSEQALKIAKEIKDRRSEGKWLGNLGIVYRHLGEPRKAIEYYEQALKNAKETGDRESEGLGLGNIGNAYLDLGELRKAIEYHEKALKIAKEMGDRNSEGLWLGNLGSAYGNLNEYRKAIEYHEKALKIAKEIGNRNSEGSWLKNLGTSYIFLSEPGKAIEYFEQAIKIDKEIEDRSSEGDHLRNLGLAYRELGEPRKAIEYYEQALNISKEIEDKVNEILCLENLGTIYLGLKDIKGSISFYENALTISKHIKDRNKEFSQLLNIGNIYKNSGLIKTAIIYYEKALLISEEINDMDMINTCENMIIASRNHY